MCCDSKIAQSDWQNHCAGLRIYKHMRRVLQLPVDTTEVCDLPVLSYEVAVLTSGESLCLPCNSLHLAEALNTVAHIVFSAATSTSGVDNDPAG